MFALLKANGSERPVFTHVIGIDGSKILLPDNIENCIITFPDWIDHSYIKQESDIFIDFN
ncbi:hypothetical protein QUF74_06970 [Candidatus Halobeggiatoa sp. HSG11]|nr:hypothetical protein [Candidatus Halobeggiatoa sp. HSG11]